MAVDSSEEGSPVYGKGCVRNPPQHRRRIHPQTRDGQGHRSMEGIPAPVRDQGQSRRCGQSPRRTRVLPSIRMGENARNFQRQVWSTNSRVLPSSTELHRSNRRKDQRGQASSRNTGTGDQFGGGRSSRAIQTKTPKTALVANLTLQTRRRFISSMPRTAEQLRTKYQVLSNMWLLAKLRQPGRSLCTSSNSAKTQCDVLKKALPPVQHFRQRTTVHSIVWNIGSLFLQWPMQGQKRQASQERSFGEQSQLVRETAGNLQEQPIEITSQAVGPH